MRSIKGILNKLTPEKFDRLLSQLLEVGGGRGGGGGGGREAGPHEAWGGMPPRRVHTAS